ncbi:MAG: hypothetical protein M0R80_26375 [Proteobacteria bacterium]|jgi:hypothetical protein|nr:hypothetical protein [Pseudomonadota bacterium]
MRFHTGKGLFAFAPFCTALVVSMGVDCCQEPVVFPEPVQGSFAPDEGSELIQAWDFATCEAGWTSSATNGNPVWSCGEPTIGPRAGVEGSGTVLATKINVEIPANMDESIISPTVDLSAEAGGSVFLSVWHWYNFPGAVDGWSSGGGRVEVFSNDQWVPIEPAGGYDGTISAWGKSLNGKQGFTAAGLPRVWRQSYFDVTPYIGPQFKVRFHAVNIVDLNKEGWYIDNVELWRGSVSAHVPSADLGACEPGRSLTFAFNSCDEGFGVLGDKVWQCGVPTRDRGMSQYDGPLTDGPAFDRDDSGLTWGTELSGHLPKGAESALVTPAVNAGGCANGSLKLGFWNWYHFGTGGGGFVQAFDGIGWVDVAPEDGYPGVIGGGMQWRKAYGHDAFVTTNDKPSGWQYQVIDLTPFINNELRVRFVVSADNTATRPGWYVDTVEFVRDILDSVSPLQGTPNEPMCGLATTSLSAADVDPTVKRDPCTEGEPVLDWQSLENEITPNGPVTTHSFDVQHPEGGSLCIVLSNGSPRFSSTSISVDDQVYYANEGFDAQTNILRKVIPASGRASHIEVNLDGEPGSNAEIQVLHLDSEGTKPIFRPDGSATSFSNLTLGYHDEMRYTGEENPRTVKMYDINFDIELPKTVYGTMGIGIPPI